MLTKITIEEAQKIFGSKFRNIEFGAFKLLWTDYEDTLLIVNLCQNAQSILELGTYKGHTTQNIATHSRATRIVTVDLIKELAIIPKLNIQSNELLSKFESGQMIRSPHVLQIKSTSDDFFDQNEETFDAIFIDANHEKEFVIKDSLNALKVLNPDGVIIWHDVYNHDNSCEKCLAEPANTGVIDALQELNIPCYKIGTSWIGFYKHGSI